MKREFSAGGAVFKKQNGKILWLLIQPKGRERWQLPKGWIDEGEDAKKAALREVAEEGGIQAELIDKIDTISIFFRYSYTGAPKDLVNKQITFFLMKYQGETKDGPDKEEIGGVSWSPYDDAYGKLTFKSEKEILEKAKNILEEKEKQPRLL
jgi:8-oxo-dGTP pyrophosphatase MutT (NUDIX family)